METNTSSQQIMEIEEIAAAITRLADRHGHSPETVISRIENQVLDSLNGRSKPMDQSAQAHVEYSNEPGMEGDVLIINACQIGGYLTTGRETLRIPISLDDQSIQQAVDQLFDSKPDISTAISLGNKVYTLDCALKFDVYDALMGYLARGHRSNRKA